MEQERHNLALTYHKIVNKVRRSFASSYLTTNMFTCEWTLSNNLYRKDLMEVYDFFPPSSFVLWRQSLLSYFDDNLNSTHTLYYTLTKL